MASIRNDGVTVDYRDPMGRKRTRRLRNKTEAKKFAQDVEVAKRRGEFVDPRRWRVHFGVFAEDWLATTIHLREKTQQGYALILHKHVLPYFATAPLGRIERTHVQKWISTLQRDGVGPGTIRNAYRVLSKVLTEAVQSKLILHNPAQGVALPRSERRDMLFLTSSELHSLAEAIEPRFRALIYVAGYIGLRWGELAGLRLEDVDTLRGSIHVRQALSDVSGRLVVVPPKTWEQRTVPLPRNLSRILAEHMTEFGRPDCYVFSTESGTPLSKNFVAGHFKPALRRAGLDPKLRFHDLRHSAASIAINSGASVKLVQQLLGHSSATVTLDTYSHVFPSLADALKDRLDETFEANQAMREGGVS